MIPENSFTDSALEQAMSEIRNEGVDPAVIEAAAARVWARLAETAAQTPAADHEPIRGCADFQALIPQFRAGLLPEARTLLMRDHLHECVACRRVYEGRVVSMSAAKPAVSARPRYVFRWAAAAVVLVGAGLGVWYAIDSSGALVGRPIVQAVNGTLYLVGSDGTLRTMAVNQDLPDGAEIRTARDSDAVLRLRDGSLVELRERSSFSTTHSNADLTVHLGRGSVMVEAAKRRQGHLYVDTDDCRVAVTGTIFGVSSGVKGSRVSVVQGEVHVSQGNSRKVLHPGDQTVTGEGLEPVLVREDVAWSRNHDHYFALLEQLANLHSDLLNIRLPELRYSSQLLNRLPASTALFGAIPNLADYLGQAEAVLNRRMADSPELRDWWSARSSRVAPLIDKLRAASEYLGDEIVIAGFTGPNGEMQGPVFLAEVKRPGFPEFLKQQIGAVPLEARNGLVVFGFDRGAVEGLAPALDSPAGGFRGTPFYARIAESYQHGAGLLLCADLSRLSSKGGPPLGLRYFAAEQKEVNHQPETRATLGFDGSGSSIASWLAAPAPMGALEYISPEATVLAAFVVRNPADILNQVVGVTKRTPQQIGAEGDVQKDLTASLGGEFAVSLDGPAFPVPSWKLVTEVYDPVRFQAALSRLVAVANQHAAQSGHPALRTSQETVDGRTYYMLAAATPNPLTEAHYTFAQGYLIAGPTRALVSHALQVKNSGASIVHSTRFIALTPRDHYANFSAVFYQNLGTTLAPLAGLLGSLAPQDARQQQALQGLGNLKPVLVAVYGEPDRITVASDGDVLGMSLANLVTGSPGGWAAGLTPFAQFTGTGERKRAYR